MIIGLADAKVRLSEMIDRVETGEIVIISHNGKALAEIRALRRVSTEEAVRRTRAINKRVRPDVTR
ncbi:MAG: type II toxin-antitoxin system prevent-host-death family antitoxin [Candidatus Eremiobacteraeota bacterium]|nr:type II toxin-antitoxin system prevent-host-death family antitoxin [Candidatus Eremiobacteraeota bacterium]